MTAPEAGAGSEAHSAQPNTGAGHPAGGNPAPDANDIGWDDVRAETIAALRVITAGDVPFVETAMLSRLMHCLDTFDKLEPYTLEDGLILTVACGRGLIDGAAGRPVLRTAGDEVVDRYRDELMLSCRSFAADTDGFEKLMSWMRRIALSELEDLRGNHDRQLQSVHRWFLYVLALGPMPTEPYPEWIKAGIVRSLPRSLDQVSKHGEQPLATPEEAR